MKGEREPQKAQKAQKVRGASEKPSKNSDLHCEAKGERGWADRQLTTDHGRAINTT